MLLNDASDEDSDATSWGKRFFRVEAAWCCCIAGLVGLCCLLLAAWVRGNPGDTCLAFDQCPEWPLPYEHGEYPLDYANRSVSLPFPEGFVWGMGTAAYQIEGGYRDGGRGASIWDTYTGANTVGMPGSNCSYCCKEAPCSINDGMKSRGATGNVACNHYHDWKKHIALMKSMGLRHYRFSISWPRVLPTGRLEDGVNDEGIKFYNNLIDGLLEAGITPYVSLYHWDLPQGLLDPPSKLGWWSFDAQTLQPTEQITKHYVDYANTCFSSFGDRVKFWTTFNEPWTFLYLDHAPNVEPFKQNSSYVAAHNVLLAHAAAVQLYRSDFQKSQGGVIGITLNQDWSEPRTTDPQDVAAGERMRLSQVGWFAEPIFSGTGDYPTELRRLLGDRLPRFTQEQRELINGSADFFGLNHYGTNWVSNNNEGVAGWLDAYADVKSDGFEQGQSSWLHGGAFGFRKLLNWIDRRYNSPVIYVTESGWSMLANTPATGVQDAQRLGYYLNYTTELQRAINEDGIDVRGYFAWSFMDNFEWAMGYTERFGVTYVDFAFGNDPNSPTDQQHQPTTHGQKLYRKMSSCWLQALMASNAVVGLDDAVFQKCNASLAV